MAAGSTYTPIATTSPSGASSIDFTSIAGTYTDLVLVFNATPSGASGGSLLFQVNGNTSTNYSTTALGGTGSAASSTRETSQSRGVALGLVGGLGVTEPSTAVMHFQNYSNATTYKTVLSRGASSLVADANVILWRSTSAITSIKLYMSGSRTLTGTCTLYGIEAA